MISTLRDFIVYNEADFDGLPDEGVWEVVDGTAILLPPSDNEHQYLSTALLLALSRELKRLGHGFVVPTVNVFIPRPPGSIGEVQNRVPDLVVTTHKPPKVFRTGQAPELVIEILGTRRGNVERTGKLDDYALAGIREYWIVNRFDRAVEVYVLRGGEFVLRETVTGPVLTSDVFPGLQIDLPEIWAAVE